MISRPREWVHAESSEDYLQLAFPPDSGCSSQVVQCLCPCPIPLPSPLVIVCKGAGGCERASKQGRDIPFPPPLVIVCKGAGGCKRASKQGKDSLKVLGGLGLGPAPYVA